jgi:hypothetical protein
MAEQIVVLRAEASLEFVASACALLAGQVNRLRVAGPGQDSLVEVYAEMVLAYARLRRRELDDPVRVQIIDHLTERVGQAQIGQSRPAPRRTHPLIDWPTG